jgi:hypothetical protein
MTLNEIASTLVTAAWGVVLAAVVTLDAAAFWATKVTFWVPVKPWPVRVTSTPAWPDVGARLVRLGPDAPDVLDALDVFQVQPWTSGRARSARGIKAARKRMDGKRDPGVRIGAALV